MHIDHFEFLHKDEGSNVANCPSISRVTEPEQGYIVNGIPVDADTAARIPHTSPGEVAVFVPANVIDRVAVAA